MSEEIHGDKPEDEVEGHGGHSLPVSITANDEPRDEAEGDENDVEAHGHTLPVSINRPRMG
jgi:hypothetical protein